MDKVLETSSNVIEIYFLWVSSTESQISWYILMLIINEATYFVQFRLVSVLYFGTNLA